MPGSNSSAPGSAVPADRPEAVHLTVHSQPVPQGADEESRTRAGRWRMLTVLLVCIAPVAASYWRYFFDRPEPGRTTNYAMLVTPSVPIPPALPLRSLDGRAVPAESLRGQWLLVVVAGSACDARCERHLYLQRQWREALGRDKDRLDRLWLTLDDGSPRPEVLAAIGGPAPTTVLRTDRAALASWLVPEAGRALEDHVYVVDPMGHWMMRTPVDPDPARFKRDLDRLMRASASWDRAGR